MHTSFWNDRWLDSGLILADWANEQDMDFNPADCVADFSVSNEGWDVDKLNRVLPSEIVNQVIGRSPPREDLGPDNWIWGENADGKFSIGSAYALISGQGVRDVPMNVMKIWKWGGPSRVKFFLWLAVHERLLTNSERARRHLSGSASCAFCGDQAETVSHVLRDCPAADGVWRKLGFVGVDQNWRRPLHVWLTEELHKDRGTLFGVAAWMIWKSRNERVFSNVQVLTDQVAIRSLRWMEAVSEASCRDARCFGDRRERRWEFVAWEPGPSDGVTVNTDGSHNPSLNRATTGGIIRNSEGRGLTAFTLNLGQCSITRAEIRGAIAGLEMAWNFGFRIVELQIDSQAVVSLLTAPGVPEHQHASEVLHFQNLCKRDWRVNIRHIYREANKAADFLASQGYDFPFGIHFFPLSDCNFGHILQYDCLGVSEPRLISVDI
ncbi:Putative ribonuclease H protein At1g65750 [Linum perenne]